METWAQILFESAKSGGIVLRITQIIHINTNIKLNNTFLISIKRIIWIRLSKPIISKRSSQLSKPTSRCLFQAIKRFLQKTYLNQVEHSKNLEAFSHIFFQKNPHVDSILDISLVQFPIFCSGYSKESTDHSHFGYWNKIIFEIPCREQWPWRRNSKRKCSGKKLT